MSFKLTKKLKLAPDLNYTQSYGTAGMAQTWTIGAYSALPMRFGKLLIASPTVVFKNKSYDLLVGTQLLQEYNGIEPPWISGKQLKMCVLKYPTEFFQGQESVMSCPKGQAS
ncbi:hypothetical protein DSO57_1028567 [Entomophthora muscae]|uniref:Uncharacterized protein n=1 Tax=Entomophthora muscae TaxID=34485 RepID=A0ACC2RG95_9FUNG|nr:hypothetical protein DSO57_1028567 [Entomophthora muscae]